MAPARTGYFQPQNEPSTYAGATIIVPSAMLTRLFRFALLGLLLAAAACDTNHDTDQISTESPTTRHSTDAEPDSSGYSVDSTTTVEE